LEIFLTFAFPLVYFPQFHSLIFLSLIFYTHMAHTADCNLVTNREQHLICDAEMMRMLTRLPLPRVCCCVVEDQAYQNCINLNSRLEESWTQSMCAVFPRLLVSRYSSFNHLISPLPPQCKNSRVFTLRRQANSF